MHFAKALVLCIGLSFLMLAFDFAPIPHGMLRGLLGGALVAITFVAGAEADRRWGWWA